MIRRFSATLLSLAVFFCATASPTAASDWTGWRGPARDGKVHGFALPTPPPGELKSLWKIAVGEGHSSPVVAGGRVYLIARQGEDEVVLCVGLERGEEIWRGTYKAPYEVDGAARDHGKGPKSTPALAGGRLYTFGIGGILSSFDAASGSLKWRKDFSSEFTATSPQFGTALSPLVEAGLCIVHVGGRDQGALRAFGVDGGDVKWSWTGDGPGYASPIAVTLAGEKQVVTQTQKRLVGVAFESGRLLWSIPFRTDYEQNSVTVVPFRDFLIYSGYHQPAVAIRLERNDGKISPVEVWRNQEISLFLSTPVVDGDRVFGFSERKRGQLFCLDGASGKTLWLQPGGLGDNGSLLATGSAVAVLTSGADLIFFRPDGKSFEPLAKYHVAASPTWAHPVILPGRILVKDKSHLSLWMF